MSKKFDKKIKCYVDSDTYDESNKAPYDDKFISRKNEVIIFPNIFPNKCEDININERIKAYKKELKQEGAKFISDMMKKYLPTSKIAYIV